MDDFGVLEAVLEFPKRQNQWGRGREEDSERGNERERGREGDDR